MMFALAWILALQDNPDALVQNALEAAKAESSLKVAFKGRVDAPDSDPMDIHGTALQVGNDLLFIEYHASGGQVKFIIRKGDLVYEWHPVAEQWVDARKLADGAAGRGVQNPHEVFDSLLENRKAAKVSHKTEEETILGINLDGPKLQPLLRDLIDMKQVRWDKTTADAELDVGRDGKLKAVRTRARIDAGDKGTIKYNGEVSVLATGADREYTFFDEDKRPIPIPDSIRDKLGLGSK